MAAGWEIHLAKKEKRDKLNLQQKRRIKHNKKQKQSISSNSAASSSRFNGLIVTRFGQSADVMNLTDRTIHRCHLRQNIGAPVSGDRVIVAELDDGDNVVETLIERSSLLTRPGLHKGVKPIAANIDHVFIVVAALPDFSTMLLDRYLVAVENAGLKATVLLNKCDLTEEIKRQQIRSQLKNYKKLGYGVLEISCEKGVGLEALGEQIATHNSILVGQSGVGKSSIINNLFPQQQLETKSVAGHSRLGQHTTTRSQLFLCDNNTNFVIDSPGVREFGLWHLSEREVFTGFVEFKPYDGMCKFRDCRHLIEKGCAISTAVEEAAISPDRWQNFKKIIQSIAQ